MCIRYKMAHFLEHVSKFGQMPFLIRAVIHIDDKWNRTQVSLGEG